MTTLNHLLNATNRIQEKFKQAPNATAKMLLDQALSVQQLALDETDYAYLLLFLEAVISAKKDNKTARSPDVRFALFAQLLNEATSSEE